MKVKVRAAAAVDREGNWSIAGWKGAGDLAMDSAVESLQPGERRYWLEAELDGPEDTDTVTLTVTEVE